MKIGASFDTHYKQKIVKELMQEYACEDILVITKSRSHRFLTCYMPVFVLMLVMAGLTAGIVLQAQGVARDIGVVVLSVLRALLAFYAWYRFHIVHGLDFIIATPDMVHIYDQRGLLTRSCKVIYVNNIAGIYVSRHGLLNSMLDEGEVTIDEIGEEAHNRLWFGPVKNPDTVREKLERLIAIAMEGEEAVPAKHVGTQRGYHVVHTK